MLSHDKKQAILAAAQQWAGTPFRQHTEIIGVGADCVHLARGVMVLAGFAVPEISIQQYPLDWAKHRDRSLVLAWVESCGCLVKLPADATLQAGDLICILQGRCSHHVALMVDERQFIHTQPGRFAEFGIIDDPTYAGLLAYSYRHADAL